MGKSLSKAGCAALLCLVAASFSSAANAWGYPGYPGYPQKAPEEPPVGMPVVNDGYLTVVNTFDNESIPPRFCPPLSIFRPEDSKATPCATNKWLSGKDTAYPEMTPQALLDLEYGRGKVQLVGVAPAKLGYSVLYWRYVVPAQQTSSASAPAAAPVVASSSAIPSSSAKPKVVTARPALSATH